MVAFESFLEDLGRHVRRTSKLIDLDGDFYVKYFWDSKEDIRGDTLGEWLFQHDLTVTNLGSTPTFVRRVTDSRAECSVLE